MDGISGSDINSKPRVTESVTEKGSIVRIEVRPEVGESNVVQAGKKLTFDQILETINSLSEFIISAFNRLSVKPESASAEFGLKISAEGNVFVVKVAGESSVKVTLNWRT